LRNSAFRGLAFHRPSEQKFLAGFDLPPPIPAQTANGQFRAAQHPGQGDPAPFGSLNPVPKRLFAGRAEALTMGLWICHYFLMVWQSEFQNPESGREK